jgi:hypothetical protein
VCDCERRVILRQRRKKLCIIATGSLVSRNSLQDWPSRRRPDAPFKGLNYYRAPT